MNTVRVHFKHFTDGRLITVNLEKDMTAQEAIDELISNGIIASDPMGYNLAPISKKIMQASESFADAGVTDGETIRIIPASDAGL